MTIALGLAAALCWGIDNLISVRISRAVPAVPALAWILVSGLVVGLPVWLVWDGLPSALPPAHSVALALLSAPCYLAGNACFLRAVNRGNLSIVAPIVGLEGGIAALIGIVVLGQGIGPLTAAGLTLAVIGGLLAAVDTGIHSARGAGWALASASAYGATFVCYGEATGLSPLGVVLTTRAVSVLLLGAWLVARRQPLAISRPMALASASLGSLDVLAFTLFATAAAIGPISVASVAGAQFATIGAALGVVVLAERLRTTQYVGVAVTLVAVVILGAG
jgi:drug/metabolite transporter (DMT)-like permease